MLPILLIVSLVLWRQGSAWERIYPRFGKNREKHFKSFRLIVEFTVANDCTIISVAPTSQKHNATCRILEDEIVLDNIREITSKEVNCRCPLERTLSKCIRQLD
ncbi:hypothetical protein OSTOST_24314, partial [Ostertagia ostertagi]